VDAAGNPVPVPPRVFDSKNAASFGMTDSEFAAAYGGEIKFLDQEVLRAVDAVQANSIRPSAIVVMSDHGYTHDVDHVDVQARFGNFFAAYTPGAQDLFDTSPTPVNLFPILFNRYLGTHLPLTADRYFLAPSPFDLLELTEVADPDTRSP
jgi:hypothetical protein